MPPQGLRLLNVWSLVVGTSDKVCPCQRNTSLEEDFESEKTPATLSSLASCLQLKGGFSAFNSAVRPVSLLP